MLRRNTTLGEALRAGADTLTRARVAAPRLTAEVLLAHCLGAARPFLYAHSEDPIDGDRLAAYRAMLDRRAAGEPLQYITGVQEFYGRPFRVDPSVLIPRPETELVVETVTGLNRAPRPRILDIGAGSGAIAVSLALEIPGAEVFASDISLAAVGTAQANAAALGAAVGFAVCDRLAAWAGPFDFVVSNPPYVGAAEHEGLQREVRDHEPRIALVPHDLTPTDFYASIVAAASGCLRQGGYLVLEIGYAMEDAVRGLFGREWAIEPTRTDLQRIPRVVVARFG